MVEQNTAANKLLADVAKQRDEARKWEKILPWIICGIVAIASVAIVGMTFLFFSQYEFYESWEITQEQEPDGGNNNFFADSAEYYEAERDGE